MISSRIFARISESMMCPETSTTSVALIAAEGYSGRTGGPRVLRWIRRDLGDRNFVDTDGRNRFEAGLALIPQVPHDHLDRSGGGDGEQRADEAGQLHPDEHRQEHEQRVELDRPAHDHR